MSTLFQLYALAPRGLESHLARELEELGAGKTTPARGGVACTGDLETAYQMVLWSRLASRILLRLDDFAADSPESLYEGVARTDWALHASPDKTLGVDFTQRGSRITHTGYGAQVVKDAVVDGLRERFGRRPNVERASPDLRLRVHLDSIRATLYLDLSGESLHRRGWRRHLGEAPVRETLAAGLLRMIGWQADRPLLDPMCGSGTLVIEAGLMATDTAPGLLRNRFGLLGWRQHDSALWERLRAEAHERDRRGRTGEPRIIGYDTDPEMVTKALDNREGAGLRERIHFERRDLADLEAPAPEGLLLVNPPYGERIGEVRELEPLYRRLGDVMKQEFSGWTAGVLCGEPRLAKTIGLKPRRRHEVMNGPIDCRLLEIPLYAGSRKDKSERPLSDGAEALANRLRKNLKSLEKQARREGTEAYRIYDRDLPDYAVSADRYGDQLHVQEYQRPKDLPDQVADARLREALRVFSLVLEIPGRSIHVKHRSRSQQYERAGELGTLFEVKEGVARYLVNLTDYFDAGLFLDHRPMRRRIHEQAKDRSFLNLFAYTGSASVAAALGGAASTTTVDLSNTYLDWARMNLERNGFSGPEHRLVRADCLRWLERTDDRFDMIFLDPPTFSTSKGMEETLDIQRDHADLIRLAVNRLNPYGVLWFSTNNRRFKLDAEALPDLDIRDITKQTIPFDFKRNPKIHQAFEIRRRA